MQRNPSHPNRIGVGILAAALVASPIRPATLTVDDDGTAPYASIQAAIDDAVPGVDDVFVRCGRYFENLTMRDGVSVRGEDRACTFVDPADPDLAVIVMTDVAAGTELSGLTIENRMSPRGSSLGIAIDGGGPVITRNVIRGPGSGAPMYSGVGIYAAGSAPVISYNVIRGNYDCCFGGGITLAYYTPAIIRSNLIVDNAAYYGAGIYAGLSSEGVVSNNTIVGNEGWVGGGVMVTGDGTLANNVIAFNTAQIYGGGVADWSNGTTFVANDTFGNTPDDYSGSDPTGTDGNISTDPRFVDRYATGFAGFMPRSDSPLIDRADPAYAPAFDFRGIARPVDGDASGFGAADIGARENEGVTRLRHDGIVWIWDPGLHEPMDYHVYRGDLDTLKETGVYTQDPDSVPGAREFCDVGFPLGDSDVPEPGRAFFYLTVAWGNVEGTLGFDSDLVERPNTRTCALP